MIRVADYIIDQLVKNGIKHVFLITGRGILYLTDAVAKNSGIQGISTFHEQGASYAAMAYASAKDGMSACLVSTGCAATNAVTAALCAYQDNLPVIFISGQHMLNETTRFTGLPIRTFGSQEADIISVVQSVTKYSAMITDPASVKTVMQEAFHFASEGRQGPVWIDIPLDIQNARINEDEEDTDNTGFDNTGFDKECLSDNSLNKDIDYITEKLENAKRPVVFAGGGVRSAGAVNELYSFIEKNRIPVVFSTSAADVFGADNELSAGAVGSLGGSRCGNFTVQNADYILAIGTKLASQSVGSFEQFGRSASITVVDIDSNEHTKPGVHIEHLIVADARLVLESLNKKSLKLDIVSWTDKVLHWKKIFAVRNEKFIADFINDNKIDLYHFADVLSDSLYDDATVITDAGLEELIIPSSIRYKKNQRCLFPAAQGAMGYALPAILGAHYAGRKHIVTVVGDGSFMMNMQELGIIENSKIPVKIFVINNNMYAVIRKRQKDLFRTRTIGNDPSDGVPAPDFRKIADCFNLKYSVITDEKGLKDGIKNVLSGDGAQLCEVMCVPEQPYLHMSFAFNEKRKMVKRPLEDLSPFIDRELFMSEMIIETMEE